MNNITIYQNTGFGSMVRTTHNKFVIPTALQWLRFGVNFKN